MLPPIIMLKQNNWISLFANNLLLDIIRDSVVVEAKGLWMRTWWIEWPVMTYENRDIDHNDIIIYLYVHAKDVNIVPEAVPVWPPVRYISDTGQYRCTVSGLPLFFIFINIYMYVCVCVYIYYNKYKSLP